MTVPDDLSFPGQPEHPDFWRLSSEVLRLDGEAQEGKSIEQIAEDMGIDIESLGYMATQRALRLGSMLGLDPRKDQRVVSMLGGMWLDGFAIGINFERGKKEGS